MGIHSAVKRHVKTNIKEFFIMRRRFIFDNYLLHKLASSQL